MRMHLPIANHWIDQYLYFDYTDYKLNAYCIGLAHPFLVGFVIFFSRLNLTHMLCKNPPFKSIMCVCEILVWKFSFSTCHSCAKTNVLLLQHRRIGIKKFEYHQIRIWYSLLSICWLALVIWPVLVCIFFLRSPFFSQLHSDRLLSSKSHSIQCDTVSRFSLTFIRIALC